MLPSRPRLRIIVAGLVGQYPLGGVAWDYFHYLFGLHELGHDVYYHEDTWLWPFDPQTHALAVNADYNVAFLRDFFNRRAPHLADRWHYVVQHEHHHGMSAAAFSEIARTADIFLNVSGASFFPDDLNPRCVKVFLDTDPGYNQIMLSERFAWSRNVDRWCGMVVEHDRHLTYAENIHGPDCLVPRMDFDWRTTRCVVTLPEWSAVRARPIPRGAAMSTIVTWDWFGGPLVYRGVEYGSKARAFEPYMQLPTLTRTPLLLAIGGVKAPRTVLERNGWMILDAHSATRTAEDYQDHIAKSAGEWSVAKHVYSATRSGWFSCRTACYLAAGRPAVVEETGWSRFIPSGMGVLCFSNAEQAAAALELVAANPVEHRIAAYDIAREYLAPDKVLPKMIEAIGETVAPAGA